MIYRVCECREENGEQTITILDDSVTENEFREYYDQIKRLNFLDRIDFFLKMIRYNGITLERYLNNVSSEDLTKMKSALELANKYVFDFAAAIGSFIEFIEKQLMTKQSDQAQKEFEEFRETLFANDNYRFWYYMRNYVVHYGIPFTQASSSYENGETKTEIICKRDHLLEYKEWKHAKTYVENLPERVDICSMVEPILVTLHAYYLQLLFIFRETVLEVHKYVEQFVLRHKARTGIAIMRYETEADFAKNRNGRIHHLHIGRVAELLSDLGRHPNVNITYVPFPTGSAQEI